MTDTAALRPSNPKTAYEVEDWPLRPIAFLYLGILVLLVTVALVLMWAYSSAVSDVGRKLAIKPPAPELQIDPARDLAKFRAREDRLLDRYYWVDKRRASSTSRSSRR